MKQKLFDYLMKNNISIDYDVFDYSLLIIRRYLTILCFLLPISYYFDMLYETIIFLILFSVLRKHLGGFHFKQNWACLLFSVISSLFIPYLAIHISSLNLSISIFLLMDDLILTKIIGPVDHTNKKISKTELEIYKRKALLVEFIYIAIYIICYIFGLDILANILVFTITFNVMSILFAFVLKKVFIKIKFSKNL